jgi:hypothetical protein
MERNMKNMKNEKKYMGNKRNYVKFGKRKEMEKWDNKNKWENKGKGK